MRGYAADINPRDPIQIGGDFLAMGMESAVISGTMAAGRIAALLAETGYGGRAKNDEPRGNAIAQAS